MRNKYNARKAVVGMTIQELSQLYYLTREITMDEMRLCELEIKAEPGAQKMNGMPHAGGVSDKVGDYAAEIADLKAIISAKREQCIHERNRLERYIASIEDSYIRQICTYRFVNGYSWAKVAHYMGGNNTGDGCRMAVARYLRTH